MARDLYEWSELWRHYRKCRRNKRNTINALRFETDAESNLLALQDELRSHTYRPGRSICFITDGPKPREVFAADFRDRVVHHVLVAAQERVFEPRFIHDSYACRVGKGTLSASDRLTTLLRRVTANGRRPAWALRLDVASFFPSIDKRVLDAIIARQIRDPEVLWLTRVLLFHDPTENYHFRSLRHGADPPGTAGYPIPARKSLFGEDRNCGLPIGNLTSQFWANVYLNELDQFVKRELRCRAYVRYVDDMVLLERDPATLIAWHGEIEGFLAEHLRLHLRANTAPPAPVREGVDFVGWRTWWSHRLPRRQSTGKLRRAVARFERGRVGCFRRGEVQRVELRPRRSEPPDPVGQLHQSLASYAGHLQHGASWREWEEVWRRWPWLRALFERDGWWIGPRWKTAEESTTSLKQSYRQTIRRVGSDVLVFYRNGRFIEFYGPQRLLAEDILGLRPARLPRAGYALTAGFPVGLTDTFCKRALDRGKAVMFAGCEEGCIVPSAALISTLRLASDGQAPSANREE